MAPAFGSSGGPGAGRLDRDLVVPVRRVLIRCCGARGRWAWVWGMSSHPVTPTLVALLHGPDQPGLVARVAGWIFERGGNILHADQHRDMEAGIFFQRIEWVPAAGQGEAGVDEFRAFASKLGMAVRLASTAHRPRVAIFVSKFDHCFHDLVLRWKAGEYACDLVAIISNHTDLAEVARGYGLNFHHLPVAAATKAEAEARQLALLRAEKIELVVLARYMQVLSDTMCRALNGRAINIHHSFLPSFKGAKPYHQAHERGVKLIGATAHYVTSDLDEGPIIEQDVARVDHNATVEDLTRLGRDTEAQVLARAVRWHGEHRVILNGHKTVIFK